MVELSLIILTCNRSSLLNNCLTSLALQQWPTDNFEIIVCDDGSIDDTRETVEHFLKRCNIKVTYLHQEHKGVSGARNLGIRHAQGSYLSFIADDYILPRDYIKKVFSFFKEYPGASIITFNIKNHGNGISNKVENFYYQLTLLQNVEGDVKTKDVVKSFNISASRAAVFKKEVFSKIGFFDEALTGGEDTDFSFRLIAEGLEVYFIPNYFIAHYDRNGFISLLKRRWRNAYFYFQFSQKYPNALDSFDISPFGVIRQVIKKSIRFLLLSKRLGLLKRYILFFPFILCFLSLRYFAIYRFYLTSKKYGNA